LFAEARSHRATIVDPAGIGALLQAIEDYDGLAPLVFVRPASFARLNGLNSILNMLNGASRQPK
jgi:hypothetical protein